MKFQKIKTAIYITSLIALLSVSGFAKQEKVLRIFSGGELIQEYNADDIDYVEVQDLIAAPGDVNATTSATSITIKWSAVEGATYNVYRSPDNVSYTQIAKDLTATTYTDSSPLKGSNYYKVKAIVGGIESGFTSAVAAALPDNGLESGIYLGINGFNNDLYTYPIMLLNESSLSGFNDFVNNLKTENGTIQFYAVDRALNMLQTSVLPSDVYNVAIVTFTDGLDQGSFMKDETYESNEEYLDAINKRIKEETVAGQNIIAYSIGVQGNDVNDVQSQKFRDDLGKLASSPENAVLLKNMSEVNKQFKEIANKLSESNYVQTISLTIPGLANGTKVRFTFDNVKDATNSEIYLDGVFNLKEKSLDNVEYHGLSSDSGNTIKGVVDGIFVTFTFENVRTENNVLIKSEFTDEWTYISSNSSWQINSEFDKTENSDIENHRRSAAVMLVLDCSKSLENDFEDAKSNAKDFIKTLYEASGFSSEDPSTPGKPDTPVVPEPTIYSTVPLDLSVAVWKDDTRYYLTQDQYKKANLSGYNVEGLAVLSNMGNFIISPRLIQSTNVYPEYVNKYYADVLPDKDQATVISARNVDINKALGNLDWDIFDNGYLYITKTSDDGLHYAIYLERYTGGSLLQSPSIGFIRGVKAVSADPIIWSDSRDLTLAVKKGGERFYISNPDEDLSQFDEIEGVAVFLGDEHFIIKLNDEQSGKVNKDVAMSLYSDILPDMYQAEVISVKYSDIEDALTRFGGSDLYGLSKIYLTKTKYNSERNYCLWPYRYDRGRLTYDSSGCIRGVKMIEQNVSGEEFCVDEAISFIGPTIEETSSAGKHIQPLESLEIGKFQFTLDQGSNSQTTPSYYWPMSTSASGKPTVRLYKGNTMTVTAPTGIGILSIDAVSDSGNTWQIYNGELTDACTFTASETTRIHSLRIVCSKK